MGDGVLECGLVIGSLGGAVARYSVLDCRSFGDWASSRCVGVHQFIVIVLHDLPYLCEVGSSRASNDGSRAKSGIEG